MEDKSGQMVIDKHSKPFWISPCDSGSSESSSSSETSSSENIFNKAESYKPVILNLQLIKNFIEGNTKEWKDTPFKTENFNLIYNSLKPEIYNLPTSSEMKKIYNQSLSIELLNQLKGEKEKTLANIINWTQRVAVALEEAVFDVPESERINNFFYNALVYLKSLICDITPLEHIYEGPVTYTNITRQDFPNKYRKLTDETERNIRNYTTMTVYKELLDYISDVFEHFQQE